MHLRGLSQLQTLHLYGTEATDTGLVQLGGLTELRVLSLCNTQITEAGLMHLRGLMRLQHLVLEKTQVTDAFRDEPAADAFSNPIGRGLGQLGGVFAIAANPISLTNRLTNQRDAMRRPAAFFQADADRRGKSGNFSDPLDVGSNWNLWR